MCRTLCYASAKGGGNGIGKTRCGKGVNILAIVDRHEPALSVSTHSVNQHEVTLVQLSLTSTCWQLSRNILLAIVRMIRDGIDDDLKQDGVNLIAPLRQPGNSSHKTVAICCDTNAVGSSSASLHGYYGSGEYLFAGNITPQTSGLCAAYINHHASLDNFEIGSRV